MVETAAMCDAALAIGREASDPGVDSQRSCDPLSEKVADAPAGQPANDLAVQVAECERVVPGCGPRHPERLGRRPRLDAQLPIGNVTALDPGPGGQEGQSGGVGCSRSMAAMIATMPLVVDHKTKRVSPSIATSVFGSEPDHRSTTTFPS